MLLFTLIVCIIGYMYISFKSNNENLVSPSGKYTLIIGSRGKNKTFSIAKKINNKNIRQKVVYNCKDIFLDDDWHDLFFLWDKDDRVWVYSSDIGTFYWNMNKAGRWTEHSWKLNSKVELPNKIRNIYKELKM